MSQPYSPARRLAAWGVHFYTALGLPLAYLCADALVRADARTFFLASFIACAVDASDGALARKVGVKSVVPQFDGRRLDDIVDYLHFVVLPLAALPALGLLSPERAPWVILPLMASAYGFCQDHAKTDDAFVGFPSYWNVLAVYLYVLGASEAAVIASLTVLSVLIFVPIHYIYPSRTALLKPWTVGLGLIWALMIGALLLNPHASWARNLALVSMYYPVWYLVLSAIHHRRVHA